MQPKIVSLCVIAYNEEKFLPNLFRDFLKQTYPHKMLEIVLVDSMSTDGTEKVMRQFCKDNVDEFASIRLASNEKQIQAAGWNVAIKIATGDVIVRIDAHTSIPPEFVELNMKNLQGGEFVSGGVRPCLIENDTPWGRTLLQIENSLFGSSISKARSGKKKEYVHSMFHAAYRRELFAEVGGFNENLVRTEDNEFHYRIRKAGYKLCFDPQIISYQYARSSLTRMIKQKYGNGYWVGLTLGVCPGCISVHHLVPAFFVLGIVCTSIMAFLGIWQMAGLMWLAYFAFGLISTLLAFKQEGLNFYLLLMPVLFFILHSCYGIGTILGLVKMPIKRKELVKSAAINEVRVAVMKSIKEKHIKIVRIKTNEDYIYKSTF